MAVENESTHPSANPYRQGLSVFLATGFWVGLLSPFAPGTFGSILGVLFAWAVSYLAPLGFGPLAAWQFGLFALLAISGVPICTRAADRLGVKDPGVIVWDEISALPLTFLFVSRADMQRPLVLLVGFALFRLYDISKPPPVSTAERLPDGLGVMADDWVAGIYACVSLQVLLWITAFFT